MEHGTWNMEYGTTLFNSHPESFDFAQDGLRKGSLDSHSCSLCLCEE